MNFPSPVVITSKSVVVEPGTDNDDVIITEEPVPVVEKKTYDLMDDLLEEDVLKMYRQVLTNFRQDHSSLGWSCLKLAK
jgi:hypothetical protein